MTFSAPSAGAILGMLASSAGGPSSASPDSVRTLQHFLPPILMVAGVLLIGFLLLSSVRRKIARRNAATPTPRERIEAIKARSGARDDTDAETARLLDLSQRLASQIDAKAERLQQLIAAADECIERLEGAMTTENHQARAARAEPEPDPVTRSVYALADSGRTTIEIARELDEGVGKVELILALRGR